MGHIFKDSLTRLFLGVVLIHTVVFANDREMYLAATGPTPLRFRFETERLDAEKALPPLRMEDPKPVVPSTNAEPIAVEQNAETSAAAAPVEYTLQGATNVQAVESAPISEAPPKLNQMNSVSPQMLLRYFTKGGTNEVLIPYPVEFTPPVPVRSSGSSAQYISD